MLAFVCLSGFNLASDAIAKLVFVCLSVCVCACAYMCIHRPISHFVNCGSIVVKIFREYVKGHDVLFTYF